MNPPSISVPADSLETAYNAWLAWQAQADEAQAQADKLKAVIREQLAAHAPADAPSTVIATIGGAPRVQLITSERRGLDTKQLRADHPGLAKEYETVTLVTSVRRVVKKAER